MAMSREEAWLRTWAAVAGAFNSKVADCNRYADACVAAFDERFPPMRHELTWRGTPVGQLTPNEFEEMKAHLSSIGDIWIAPAITAGTRSAET